MWWKMLSEKLHNLFFLSLKLLCHEFHGVIETVLFFFILLVETGKTGIISFDQIQEENSYFSIIRNNKCQPFG